MFNYKKSLLSIAAFTALSVSTATANYIPLTDAANNDEAWVLFGVTGLASTGAGAGTQAGTFSIPDNTANTLKDISLDDLFVEGLETAGGDALAKVKVMNGNAQIEVRVLTTGIVYSETEPVRTIYVKMKEDDSAPAFAFTYRAALEGLEIQYSINADSSNAYTVLINTENTYSNPAVGEVITEIAGLPSSSLSKIEELVDYNFADNPTDSSYYDEGDHQTALAGGYVRVYSYNAATTQWDLYDSRNTAESNDFDSLVKGKAYWARMYDNGAASVGGLVLGSATISTAEYKASGIVDGWNLIAFSKQDKDIRKSETGLLVVQDGDGAIAIYDASGNHKVALTTTQQATSLIALANEINNAISVAKLNGSVPDTFNVRVVPTGTANTLAYLSDKRFLFEDVAGDDAIFGVTTLSGSDPYVVSDASNPIDGETLAIVDLGLTAGAINGGLIAMSKYGEYSMIIEPSVSATSAARLAQASLQIQTIGAADDDPVSITDVASTANTAALDLTGDLPLTSGAVTKYTEIDTDLDGTTDQIIISSVEPFYVRDHTFTRVFDVTQLDAVGAKYTIDLAPATATLADATYANTAAFVAAIDTTAGVNAVQIAATDVVAFINETVLGNEFVVLESTSMDAANDPFDTLTPTTSVADTVKGAVLGVSSISAIAASATENVATNTITGSGGAFDWETNGNTLDVKIVNTLGLADAVLNVPLVSPTVTSDASAVVMAAEINTHIENALSSANIQATVTHTPATDVGGTVFTITSTDIKSLDLDFTTAASDTVGVMTNGALVSINPDLTTDLKYNAVYAPNYVANGPLYDMKEADFTLKALVSGDTDLSDGSVNWDSVDLTRTPSDWLDSQDYNLFKVNDRSGYWAYLETDTGSNDIKSVKAEINSLAYTYNMNIDNVNYNQVSGNIAITIDGLVSDDRAVPVVSVSINGTIVELSAVAGSNIYTGKVSSYEIGSITAGNDNEVLLNAADGLGYSLSSENIGLTLDFTKPKAPIIDLGDGTALNLSSTSTDVKGYYIFSGQIAEEDTSLDLVKKLTSEEADSYALCKELSKGVWNTALYDLNIVAVDGTGELGKGNISDTSTKFYVPMLKTAARLVDTSDGAERDRTVTGNYYDGDCIETAASINTVNKGMAIAANTDDQTVAIAFEPLNADLTGTPISIYVKPNATGTMAKITYATAYEGESVYVELDEIVYSLLLPTANEVTVGHADYLGNGDSDTNAFELDTTTTGGDTISAVQTDQRLTTTP